jgi:hypothetical protein
MTCSSWATVSDVLIALSAGTLVAGREADRDGRGSQREDATMTAAGTLDSRRAGDMWRL